MGAAVAEMKVFDFSPGHDKRISAYESHEAYALQLAEGRGEGHIYCIRIDGSHTGLTAMMVQLTEMAATSTT
jgi:hypothetical protein